MTDVLSASAVGIHADGPLVLTTAAPSSKSMSNRALLVAALADGTSRLHDVLDSDDSTAMRGAVAALGARLRPSGDALTIDGVAGVVAPKGGEVDARLSGTTLRFVAAAAALATAPVTVGGAAPLLRRPVGPLTGALRTLGARVDDHDGFPPVVASGGLAGGAVTIDASASSQFPSAVLLAAPYARADVAVTVVGQAADAYIAMTVDLMRRWGATVDVPRPRTWTVSAGVGYTARTEHVEYDASAAAHLFALAVATGGSVKVTNAAPRTLQPDAGILHVLTAMGATVVEEEGGLRVDGPERVVPVDVDLSSMPDQVTTVAVLAALAEGVSRITGVAVTRGHETDRLTALATELRKVGVRVGEQPDGLTVRGGSARGPAALTTYDDHRLAMAFAALGAAVPGIVVEDPGCVAKTYPRFWDDARRAGLAVDPRP